MTKIKFCGLRSVEAVKAANELKADFAGFILSEKFWRCVSLEKLRELRSLLSPEIKAVGVFVNEPYERVLSVLKSGDIDIAQLHGDEDDGYILRLKRETGKPIIKAFKITSEKDAERASRSQADLMLLDSGTGTGERFDWSLISKLERRFILAGGLDPENVAEAVRNCRPYAVDVSSGIETNRVKDPEKMKKFVQEVRRASADLR